MADIGLIGHSPRSVSGGFAIVQPGSKLSINAVEGFPLEDFSSDVSSFHTFPPIELKRLIRQAVRSQITEAQKIASGGGSEQDVAEAKIELEASRVFQGPYRWGERSDDSCLRYWRVCKQR